MVPSAFPLLWNSCANDGRGTGVLLTPVFDRLMEPMNEGPP